MTTLPQSALRQLAGDFPPAFKFKEVGDKVAGKILSIREPRAGELDLDGDPVDNFIFQLETDDGTKYSVWAKKPSYILSAIAKAALTIGSDLAEGGRLAVQFSGFGEPSKPGLNAPKFYTAAYQAPSTGVTPESLL